MLREMYHTVTALPRFSSRQVCFGLHKIKRGPHLSSKRRAAA